MEDQDQLLMQVTMSLAQTSRAYRSVADKVVAGYGLSQATAWPLIMIGRLGAGVRPGAVAEALGLEPSSLVRVLDQLVEAGLVDRQEDASDRRAKTLELTAAGRKCAGKLEKALAAFRRGLFDGVPEADVRTVARVLQNLGAALSSYEETAFGGRKA